MTQIIHYLKAGFVISMSASKAYKITTIAIGLIVFAANWSILQVVFKEGSNIGPFLARAIVDTALYLLVCHFFVRSYLKLSFINHPFSAKLVGKLLVYLAILSSFVFLVTVLIGKLDFLSPNNFDKVQFIGDDGTIDANVSGPFFSLMGIMQAMANFLIWAVFYIVWYANLSKKQMQSQMQEAQLKQLTNQLSPHFLFNTLNSIRALIYEDRDKAADTVTQLSELFRTHLQAHLRPSATIEEELAVCKHFLAIEGIRLEERLKVEIDVADEFLRQKLPTLTLLTLIENGTKHGISPNHENGFIKVKAERIDRSHWRLQVLNSIGPNKEGKGTRTGLANIKTRLALMFAETAKIKHKNDGTCFVVVMDLPYV